MLYAGLAARNRVGGSCGRWGSESAALGSDGLGPSSPRQPGLARSGLSGGILPPCPATGVAADRLVLPGLLRRGRHPAGSGVPGRPAAAFEQIAVLGLRRRPARTRTDGIATLAGALLRLARGHTGALVVVPGREPVDRHLLGGIPLDAAISEELLLSIFDPRSPGHDGAVLVQGDRLGRFGVLLPISEDHPHLGPGGTRHAAARGLAERCDALCVVVSEERGTVAVASSGELQVLENPEHLVHALRGHLAKLGPRSGLGPGRKKWRQVWRRGLEAVAAFSLALASWTVLVPGSTVDQVTLRVPVVVEGLPQGYVLERVDPGMVDVQVAGPRRELLLASPEDFQLVVGNTSLVRLKRRTFAISRDDVRHPTALEILGVSPEKVRLSVREIP